MGRAAPCCAPRAAGLLEIMPRQHGHRDAGRATLSAAQVSRLAQVCQHRLRCQPPALQRAVQGGGGAVVAAHVQTAAEAHGAGQVGGRRLLAGEIGGRTRRVAGQSAKGSRGRKETGLREHHAQPKKAAPAAANSRYACAAANTISSHPSRKMQVSPPCTRLVGLRKGDAVGLEVPPARHLARTKPAAQLLANPWEGQLVFNVFKRCHTGRKLARGWHVPVRRSAPRLHTERRRCQPLAPQQCSTPASLQSNQPLSHLNCSTSNRASPACSCSAANLLDCVDQLLLRQLIQRADGGD